MRTMNLHANANANLNAKAKPSRIAICTVNHRPSLISLSL